MSAGIKAGLATKIWDNVTRNRTGREVIHGARHDAAVLCSAREEQAENGTGHDQKRHQPPTDCTDVRRGSIRRK